MCLAAFRIVCSALNQIMTVNQVERKVLGKNSSLEFVACFEESQEALAQCSMIAKCNSGFMIALNVTSKELTQVCI